MCSPSLYKSPSVRVYMYVIRIHEYAQGCYILYASLAIYYNSGESQHGLVY